MTATPTNLPPLWIDALEADRLFHVSDEQLRRWTREGRVHPARLGRRMVRYNLQELQQLYLEHQV